MYFFNFINCIFECIFQSILLSSNKNHQGGHSGFHTGVECIFPILSTVFFVYFLINVMFSNIK